MIGNDTHVEIEFYQRTKTGEDVCGDDFKTVFMEQEDRHICVLSDGLGSGIKASLLANMTTAMAIRFSMREMEVVQSSEIIMDSLPVCEVRKISYATFSIADIMMGGRVRITEMDNPPFIHLRNGEDMTYPRKVLASEHWPDRQLQLTQFEALPEDRIVLFSDGVSQAGLGRKPHKFGWKREGCLEFIRECIANNPAISARDLSRSVVIKACSLNPDNRCIDDITCAVIYFRKPRRLRLLTGPPFRKQDDRDFADLVNGYEGRKVVCGGTTANIISRELNRPVKTKLFMRNGGLPPISEMAGIDLVTEGILTLTETAKQLENETPNQGPPSVRELMTLFLESDIIEFVVGTRVNEAHQDPSLPVDLEIRRNIIKRIKASLETRYRKKVILRYI